MSEWTDPKKMTTEELYTFYRSTYTDPTSLYRKDEAEKEIRDRKQLLREAREKIDFPEGRPTITIQAAVRKHLGRLLRDSDIELLMPNIEEYIKDGKVTDFDV